VNDSAPGVVTLGMRTKLLVAVAIMGATLWMSAPAAMAKGTSLDPVHDRYEVGDTATLIGYSTGYGDGDLTLSSWTEAGNFMAYLRVDEAAVQADNPQTWPVVHPTDIPLGAPVAEVLPDTEETFYSVRVSLTFVVPPVEPGSYGIVICNDPCTTGLGDIMGGEVTIGMDPPSRAVRAWPTTEPAIAELHDDALVWPPSFRHEVTAAQLRSGVVPEAASQDESEPTPEAEPAAVADTDDSSESDGGSGSGGLVVGGGALVVAGLVVLARRFGPGRKSVTSGSAMSPQLSPDLRSGPPKRIRL
jgi:hypothetical protein